MASQIGSTRLRLKWCIFTLQSVPFLRMPTMHGVNVSVFNLWPPSAAGGCQQAESTAMSGRSWPNAG